MLGVKISRMAFPGANKSTLQQSPYQSNHKGYRMSFLGHCHCFRGWIWDCRALRRARWTSYYKKAGWAAQKLWCSCAACITPVKTAALSPLDQHTTPFLESYRGNYHWIEGSSVGGCHGYAVISALSITRSAVCLTALCICLKARWRISSETAQHLISPLFLTVEKWMS